MYANQHGRGGASPPPTHAGPGGVRDDDAPWHATSMHAPPPTSRPGPASAHNPATHHHHGVGPSTVPNAGGGATDPQYAHADCPDPAWRTRAMPRVDATATNASAHAPAADLDRITAPHRTAPDATGDDLAPFTWPTAAAVHTHPGRKRDGGVDRHTMMWFDPIRDGLPYPDHDPHQHGRDAAKLLPPPTTALVATHPDQWPHARMNDQYLGHSRYHEPYRAANRRDQQDLWHPDLNARLPHASGHDASREERDPAGLGFGWAALAHAAPSPPFSPPTARRAAHASRTNAVDAWHDAPAVPPPPAHASWPRARWTAASDQAATGFFTAAHDDRTPWAYHGGASQPVTGLYDAAAMPTWRSSAPDRAHRDRPWYGAPYSPWTAPGVPPASPYVRCASPLWQHGNDGTWSQYDRAGQATWPPPAAAAHGPGPWRPTGARYGLVGHKHEREHVYGGWRTLDGQLAWAAADREDVRAAQNEWTDTRGAWPAAAPAAGRVTAWPTEETQGGTPWPTAWSGAQHGGDGGDGVWRGASAEVLHGPDWHDHTALRDAAGRVQNVCVSPRHPSALLPPLHQLPPAKTAEHEPKTDVTVARDSTFTATKPDGGHCDPVSIPSHGAPASASASVASPPRAEPTRRVQDGGRPTPSGPSSTSASATGVTGGSAATAAATAAATRRSAPDSDRALLAVVKNRRRRAHLPTGARATLLAWVEEHRESPYPTRTEKNQLMTATGLTLSQVENFFVNFRRRSLKKFSAPNASILYDRTGEPTALAPPSTASLTLDMHAPAPRFARPLAGRGDHGQLNGGTYPLLPAPRRGS